MKETSYKNVHRQINSLISLIEICLPLTEEVNQTKDRLKFLPGKLEYLKIQAEYIQQKTSYTVNTKNSLDYSDRHRQAHSCKPWEIEDTEVELDFLLNSLEDTLIYLERLKGQISDLVVLRERVEALQEERLVGITPERIYKLIEKQQLENSVVVNDKSQSSQQKPFARIFQQIADYKYSKRIVKGAAIAAGVILCFSLGSYSSVRYQINENSIKTQETELKTTPTDI